MNTHDAISLLIARAKARALLTVALVGAAFTLPTHSSLAQVLELPPPEVGEETLPMDNETSASVAKPSASAPGEVGEEEVPDPQPEGETEARPGERAESSADSGSKTTPSASEQKETTRPLTPMASGSGLIWFGVAFVVLVIAIFVFT